ncbi:MAG: hypothetical protein AAGL24_23870 [Pseudomonadota bacterium]
MITLNEVYAAILHSWALFRGDRGALRAFDASFDGFWRSFGVIVVLAPFYALIFVANHRLDLGPTSEVQPATLGQFVSWQYLSALVDWVTFPAVIALLAGPLNIANRFALLIVAHNWTSILAILPGALVSLLFAIGVLQQSGFLWLSLIVMIVLWRFRYQVYSAALGGPTGLVIALVAMEFVLSLFIAQSINLFAGLI